MQHFYPNLKISVLLPVLFALSLLNPTGRTAVAAPEAEVVHWWKSGGDREAVNVLVEAFNDAGGEWFDESTETYYSTRETALSRMAKGYPPTAIQWNAGTEVRQFADLGLLNVISDKASVEKFRNLYNEGVFEAIFHNDAIIALPVNIHGENWFWKNSELFDSPDTEISDWGELLRIAKKLQKNGKTAFAVGDPVWQQRILFNSILLSVLGPENYELLLEAKTLSLIDTPDFEQAVDYFMQTAEFSKSFGSGGWQEQVKAVADGEAAGMFMGDWAKGEFLNLGARLGKEVDCALAPGTEGLYQPVFDVFLFGKVDNADEIAGQKLLAEVALDKQVSVEFNKLKGSVPPFKVVNEADLDVCGKQVASMLASESAVLRPFASFSDGEFHSSLEQAINQIWSGNLSTVESAKVAIRDVLVREQQRQQERTGGKVSELEE